MPGLKRQDRLSKLVLLLPCDEELEATLDTASLAKELDDPDRHVFARSDERLCGPDRTEVLAALVQESGAEALVVGGPSPRTQGHFWRDLAASAGIPADRVELVPLLEQCVYITDTKEDARRRARIMLEAAMARVDLGKDLVAKRIEAMEAVLVIGGGVAGMQAAWDLGELGRKAYLVERSDTLGGRAHKLSRTYPTQDCKPDGCCPQSCRDCQFTPEIGLVMSHPRIEVLLGSEVKGVRGGYGGYHVDVETPEGQRLLDVGAIVVATGNVLFDPIEMPELSPEHPDVITFLELEELIDWQRKEDRAWTPLRRPSDGKVPRSIHFLQCVGSRDAHHGTLDCSLVCCTYAIGQATDLKQMLPKETIVSVHYMDLRGPYRGFERHYLAAQEEGVLFLRGRVVAIEDGGDHLVVEYEDIDLGEPVSTEADLVVLSVGQLPTPGMQELAEVLGVPLDEDGYLGEDNSTYSLWDRRGIYVIGCAAGPRGIRYSVRDGREAALSIDAVLRRTQLELAMNIAEVDDERCTGCGQCVEACEYGAITLEERTDLRTGRKYRVAVVDPRMCWGCGNCHATCPSTSIRLSGFTDDQLVREIEIASGGG
jgi:heterodisulfide reductase subunit A-like polyferredoxin